MGTFLDCRVDKSFAQLEISEEIINKKEKKNLNLKQNLNKKDIKNKKNVLNKNNKKLINVSNATNNEDEIIINTDDEKSNLDNEKNNNKITKFITKTDISNNNNKKINNTIFINNSNVTISQRNNKEENKNNKDELEINEIKNDFNRLKKNEENLELDELLNKVFNNNNTSEKNICINNKRTNLLTESALDYNYNKEYFDNLYTDQTNYVNTNTNNSNNNLLKTENNDKIISKLKQLKEKINNKKKGKDKVKRKYKQESRYNISTTTKAHRTLTMTNKQIRKNIPSYRKNHQRGFFNSISFNKNNHYRKFRGYNNYSCAGLGNYSLGNSFSKSLYSSMMCESVKEHFYSTSNNNDDGNNLSIKRSQKETQSFYSMQKSYFNNSSINQNSSYGKYSQSNYKEHKRLYNVVSKNRKNKSINKTFKNKNKNRIRTLSTNNQIIKFDINKEIENDKNDSNNINNNLLYHQYRDIIEINLPINYPKDSLIDKNIYKMKESNNNNNNKIILNYNKLNNYKTSIILYDGNIYKVSDKKNSGFKLSKRYFQISKNCFRYYNSFLNAKNEEKPLVQFDIRYIKDLQIIENDFLKEYQIDKKDIEIVFVVYLYQNDDFFVFAFNNEKFGKNVFNILNLLKNYYEDKK